MLLTAILPTSIFHLTLRIKLSNWFGSEPKEGKEVEVATDDEISVITLPLIYIFLCLFLLFTSSICTELQSDFLSKTLPPIMNQWGLTGLLPFYAMKMPVYPLLSGNLLLFGVMTTLNVLFLARKKWIKIVIFAICGVYLIIVTIFRSLRLNSSTVFTDLLVDESTTLFVGESQSYLFGVHYVILLSIAFMSISMTGQRIGE